MRRLRNHLIGIDQGEVILFSDFQSDGEMWVGEGDRRTRTYVSFSEPFRGPPAVSVGPTMWDISNSGNARMDLGAEDVTDEGFAILFQTWGDTRIARIRVGWQAIGELRHVDDWDLY